MISKELYKKDKAVIRELSGRTRTVSAVYFLISAVLVAAMALTAFFGNKNDDFLVGYTMVNMASFMPPYLSLFLWCSGLTSYTGIKNSAAAREMFKGSTLFIDTLSCIPIRRESLLRYIMKGWRAFALLTFELAAVNLTAALWADGRLWLFGVASAAYYFIFTFLMFFQIYAFSIRSRSVKKLLDVSLIVLMAASGLLAIANCFIAMIVEAGEYGLYDKIFGIAEPSSAAAVILLAAAVIYHAAMEAVFGKFILAKKGAGWHE